MFHNLIAPFVLMQNQHLLKSVP